MKKTKKLFGIIMAAMLTATMLLGSFSASAANEATSDQQSTGTEANPAQAKVVKVLKYADGITEPSIQFNFSFEKISIDKDTSEAAKAIMPELSASVDFSVNAGKYTDKSVEGMKTVSKQSDNIFIDENGDRIEFPHAGVYTYKVTEDGDDDEGYGMDYSEAVYNMRVYVKNGKNGTYVACVTAEKITDDAGETITGGQKVNPKPDNTPGNGIDNKFEFVNVFTKRGGSEGNDNTDIPDPIPEVDDDEYPEYLEKIASLVIDKTVAGDYGDKTKEFKFKLMIKRSPTSNIDDYKATIYTRGNAQGTEITFSANQAKEFYLKDNQMLIFEDLPAGTRYNISEDSVNNYTATTQVVANGKKNTYNAIVMDALVGEKDNYARYTNTFDDDSIILTGIIINNLPFIIMIVLAGAGIVFFVISRRRKYDR